MASVVSVWVGVISSHAILSSQPILRDYVQRHYYTLYSPTANTHAASVVARHLGCRFDGQVGELVHYYWISVPKQTEQTEQTEQINVRRDTAPSDTVLSLFSALKKRTSPHSQRDESIEALTHIERIDRQLPQRRLFKRSLLPLSPEHPMKGYPEKKWKVGLGDNTTDNVSAVGGFSALENMLGIQDPGFDKQWHMMNRVWPGNDMNVSGVWQQNITGQGVVVAILDDGLDMDSEDLKDNFAKGSYDFNQHSLLKTPTSPQDFHGTRCAGEIAAVRNDVCGVGIAYGAKVSGIRILSMGITEGDEAEALNYKYQENDIYSCSWGPPDLGQSVEAPHSIVIEALKNGVEKGRHGYGSLYVFASGNGGANDDNCNYDGYTNSIYTITVGAIDRMNRHPYYAEKCSAQLVVAYSSGSGSSIYTTDVGRTTCTDQHGGTSAAAPLAAGVFALVLSVRPDLTWRDIQYLCVHTAVPIALKDEDWTLLPSQRQYNHKFGYGRLDSYAMVEAAKTFKSVGPSTCVQVATETAPKEPIPDTTGEERVGHGEKRGFYRSVLVSPSLLDKAGFGRLEHVTATVTIEHSCRGDLEILLESPQGVQSQLGTPREHDTSNEGFLEWTFMSVKHWGENPVGHWTLRIIDHINPHHTGHFIRWKLTLWGEQVAGGESTLIQHTQTQSSLYSLSVHSVTDTYTHILTALKALEVMGAEKEAQIQQWSFYLWGSVAVLATAFIVLSVCSIK
ncbi:peptidase S8/S53 domain-containing protein [Spinellus fusiger]|nr:peptidase S8/S53 domain-containing protein [Spinellus fusiger]